MNMTSDIRANFRKVTKKNLAHEHDVRYKG